VRTVLQCAGAFPDETGVDWLYDVSFGTGVKPKDWPALPAAGPFCGYSGGIGPETVVEILGRIAAPDGTPYWIDMESGIRTDGAFDLTKCEAVCRAVYG
jgi:phosphoribosylanthranilate isomerase